LFLIRPFAFQLLKSLRKLDGFIEIIHPAGYVSLAEPIAGPEDIAERQGHAFVIDQVVLCLRCPRSSAV
jgi:hypothetical protein